MQGPSLSPSVALPCITHCSSESARHPGSAQATQRGQARAGSPLAQKVSLHTSLQARPVITLARSHQSLSLLQSCTHCMHCLPTCLSRLAGHPNGPARAGALKTAHHGTPGPGPGPVPPARPAHGPPKWAGPRRCAMRTRHHSTVRPARALRARRAAVAARSPLFLKLFVCPPNPLARSPPLPLAESPPCRLPHRVSPVVSHASAGSNVSAQARVSLALACTSTASLKMHPHLCNSGLKSPPVSMRRAGYDSCE